MQIKYPLYCRSCPNSPNLGGLAVVLVETRSVEVDDGAVTSVQVGMGILVM